MSAAVTAEEDAEMIGDSGVSEIMAGVLHRNHIAMAERGPWKFVGMKAPVWQTETCRETGTTTEVQGVAGTCDCCGSPIKDVAQFLSAAGERVTLGLDCAATFKRHLANPATFDVAARKRAATKRAAAKERAAARNVARNADTLGRAEALAAVPGFAGRFGASLAAQIRAGKRPSDKQMVLLAKLESEQA